MDKDPPIERRDFLKSATAASVLAGATPLVACGDEAQQESDGKQKDQNRAPAAGALVGLEAADCFAALVRGMDHVDSVYVVECESPPPARKREIENGFYYEFKTERPVTLSSDEEKIISKALPLFKESKLSFWDAVMLSSDGQENVPSGLLEVALYHQNFKSYGTGQFITREQLLTGALRRMCQKKSESKWIGVTSIVTLDNGTTAHIPLLDFNCRVSPQNRRLVAEAAKRLLPGGAIILESGASYHAYGRNTVPTGALAPLLAKALLIGHVVDHRYIAHRLIDGRCTLRLSAGGREKRVPLSVEVV